MEFEYNLPGLRLLYDDEVMKPGTDGVLLGNWASQQNFNRALDLGCGMGLISFMMALANQSAHVIAVDYDENAIQLCNRNKEINQSLNNIEFYLADFFNTSGYLKTNFDLVVSNPPYLIDQLESTVQKRTSQRHWSKKELIGFCNLCRQVISNDGTLLLVLPAIQEAEWTFQLMLNGFCLNEIIKVKHLQESKHSIYLLRYCLHSKHFAQSEIILSESENVKIV
ncbi:MAG: methyltransferase [Saprospiraceae bacterium]|nr:methyltransferase [Saprospiraceae bacterium]